MREVKTPKDNQLPRSRIREADHKDSLDAHQGRRPTENLKWQGSTYGVVGGANSTTTLPSLCQTLT
ncbi:MAG: hypothetical protein VXY07_17820, partial [Planctomycetota bacterium]|nr:hypothetical protein [Planctomycetota bacterium]